MALSTVVGFVLLFGATAVPASAETPTPTPTASGTVTVTLAPLGDGEVASGDTLPATLTVDNGTSSAVTVGAVGLVLGDQAITDRAALQSWLDGDGTTPAGTTVATSDVGTVEARASGGGSFLVAAEDAALTGRAAGVYPLWITSDSISARSVIVVPDGTAATVGVVVPITAGALETGLLTADELSTLTAEDGSLTQQLDAVEGTNAILAVDPAIAAAIRVLGTSAPTTARAWLTRLEQLPNSRFALQFGDADVTTQLAAGLSTPISPTSLVSYIDDVDLPAEPDPSPSASESSDSSSTTTVPDLTTLLDVGETSATAFWPPAGSTSTAAVDTLAQDSAGALTLVASTAVASGAEGATVSARGQTTAGSGVLVYDAAISTALGTAASAADLVTRSAALATASAFLSFAAADAGGAPLLVTVERGGTFTETGLRAAITAITDTTGVSITALDGLTTASSTELALVDGTVDASRTSAVSSLTTGADRIAAFATILDDPALLTGAENAEILQLLGSAWIGQNDAWQAALSSHSTQTQDTLDSVSIVQPTSINLLTAGTNLKFWIHNALPYPVNVVLLAAPDDLRLTVERATEVTAVAGESDAASNTPVEVPVLARIANGEVSITLALRSPTMEPIGADQVVEVNVRADWENVGLALLAVLIGGFVTLGVIRTVRHRRRIARAREAEGEDGS